MVAVFLGETFCNNGQDSVLEYDDSGSSVTIQRGVRGGRG